MKKSIIFFILSIGCIYLLYWYNNTQDQKLFDEYQQKYISSIKANNKKDLMKLASEIENVLHKHNSEKWKLMYVNILISQLHEYKKAVEIMETMPIMHQNAGLGIGLCLLKEYLEMPYKACYQTVINNVPEPKYNDLNYWGAIGALNQSYSEEEIKKSEIPREFIEFQLNPNRKEIMKQFFPE